MIDDEDRNWGPIYFRLACEHGLTYRQIGEMTWEQVQLLLSLGKSSPPPTPD